MFLMHSGCFSKGNPPSGREVVSTTEAPSAFGPYSQAVKTNSGLHSGLVFVAGQLGVDPQVTGHSRWILIKTNSDGEC